MSDASHRIDADELLAHAAWLRALARSLVRDEHAADDVVQETFAAAIDRPPREPGALRGWLARVARNAAWKARRGERRRAAREDAAPRRAAEPSAAECVERIEMQRALLDAVQELDPPLRTVVLMRFYDGKAPREIAAELSLPPEVVWQRLSRATAVLRARLDRRYGKRETWALVLMSPLGAKSAAAWSASAAVGTGVAIVGTKTVLAAATAAALGAWLLWPRDAGDPNAAAPPKATETAAATAPPAGKPTVASRIRPVEEAAAAATAAPDVPHARVRGRVVDAVSGEPIAGARVIVARKSATAGFRWTLETGADGAFAGDVAEIARYDGETPWTSIKCDLYVEAGARGHIRFYEGPYTGAKGDDLGDVKLDRGVVVRGRVVTAAGAPAPGADVFATSYAAAIGHDFPLTCTRALGRADEFGRFELDEALAPAKGDDVYTLLAASKDGVGFTTVAVRRDREPVHDVTIPLRAGVVDVCVRDENGHTIAGAEVSAQPRFDVLGGGWSQPIERTVHRVSGGDALRSHFVATTGSDGVARFDALAVGERGASYEFAVTAPGFITAWIEGWPVDAKERREVGIALKRAHAYVAAARIVDADGGPVDGASVVVESGPKGSAVSGADGSFVLARGDGDPLGRYADVTVTKDGLAKRRATVWRWPDDGRKTSDIRMLPPSAVEGVVVDQDGKPVEGAFINLHHPDPDAAMLSLPGNMRTQADGRFAFPDATAGDWALRIQPPIGAVQWEFPDEVLVPGGKRDVVARIERREAGRATLVVTVVDAESGEAVDPEAAVAFPAHTELGRMYAVIPVRVDSGRVVAEHVRPGDYVLWVRVADRPRQLVRFRVTDSDTDVRATLRVRRAVALSGRVVLPAGLDAKDVRVSYEPADRPPNPGGPGWETSTSSGTVSVGADGAFKLEGLTPTVYRFEVTTGTWLGESAADASQGDAATEIRLEPAALVRFRGTAADGTLSIPITVSLDGGPWTALTTIGLAGDMTFARDSTLRPGRLRWRATFRRSYNPRDPFLSAAPQEGEAVLEAGKETDVVVTGAASK